MWRKWRRGQGSPSLRVQRGTLLVALSVGSLANGLFVPLSLLYLQEVTGAPLIVVGWVLTAASALTLPLPFLLGGFVDSIGPKRLILAAQGLLATGFAVYALSASLGFACAGALLLSLGQRTFSSSIYTLVGDVADRDPRERSRESGLAVIGSMRAIGYGVGALVAGIILALGSVSSARVAIAVVALVVALCVIAVLLGTTDSARTRVARVELDNSRPLRRNRPYVSLITLNCGFALCNVMLSLALPPFVKGSLPSLVWLVGPCLVLNTVMQASLQTTVVRLVSRLRRGTALALAAGCWAAWAVLTVLALAVPEALQVALLFVAVLLYSSAQLIHSPISNAIAVDAAPLAQRGRYLSAFQNSFAIAQLVAPTLYASVSALSPVLFWLVVTAIAVVLLPATRIVVSRLPDTATGAPRPSVI